MTLATLFFSLFAMANPGTVPASGVKSVDFLTEYCLGQATVEEKKLELTLDGWKELFDPAKGFEETRNFRVFQHESHHQIITITSPTDNPNEVRDCCVDGKDIDAKQIIDTAISRWGIPTKGGAGLAYWSLPNEYARTVILAESHVANRDPNIAAFQLVVRFGTQQVSTKAN